MDRLAALSGLIMVIGLLRQVLRDSDANRSRIYRNSKVNLRAAECSGKPLVSG